MGVAEELIQSIDWSAYEVQSGPATGVPAALLDLLMVRTPEEAKAVHWRVENHVVVQGGVYSSGVPTTMVLVAALLDERNGLVRHEILALLYEILAYGDGEDTVERCREVAREGLWLLIREYLRGGSPDAAMDVIEVLGAKGRLMGLTRNPR